MPGPRSAQRALLLLQHLPANHLVRGAPVDKRVACKLPAARGAAKVPLSARAGGGQRLRRRGALGAPARSARGQGRQEGAETLVKSSTMRST
jgi:hypothetical protein